eukprot:CAMPEP_0118924142 /NCGR_PEP_ID=MMETSP1169-20130426/2412_1 /TAXON_ID=36882 /ORGANISM="Pyramimonas obovata, Strain CCMP722" /LENGTH=340 /DNA_ID=CAMNT_0006865229 /DNA_START=119 /DNA_END=1141 /DNA_ORIENTATION=+
MARWVGQVVLGLVVLLGHSTTVSGLRLGDNGFHHNDDEMSVSSFQLAMRSMGLERAVYVPFNASSSTTQRDQLLAGKRANRQLAEENVSDESDMLKGLSTCSSHEECDATSYCDKDQRCWSCRDLAGCCVLHDTFDGSDCPASCECSSAAYMVSADCDTSNWCKKECGSMDQCEDNVWAQYKCPSQIEYCTNNGRANCYCVTKSLGPASIFLLVTLLAVAACSCILVCMHSDYLLGTEIEEEGTRLMVAQNPYGFSSYGAAPVTTVEGGDEQYVMDAAAEAEWRRAEHVPPMPGGSIKMTKMQGTSPPSSPPRQLSSPVVEEATEPALDKTPVKEKGDIL